MAITLDGTDGVTTTGLTSNGIDDNATSTAITIDASENVGIGTASPGATLETSTQVVTNSNGLLLRGFSWVDGEQLSLSWIRGVELGQIGVEAAGAGSAGELVFSTAVSSSLSERMRITSSGNLLVGTTSGSLNSYTHRQFIYETGAGSASAVQGLYKNSTSNGRFFTVFHNPNGIVGSISSSATSVSYNTSSDYRLKENVVTLDNATDRLNQIPVHRFNFIASPDTTVDGFLAHEVQAIVPEAIHGVKDEVDDEGNPVYQGIDQSKLVPLLVATVKELEARIATLEAN